MRYALILMILLALPAVAGETRLRKKTHRRGGMLYYDAEKIVAEDGFKVKDSADVMLKAGERIVIKPGTHFKPGRAGKTHLVIATRITASTSTPTLEDSNTPCETDPSPPPKPKWRRRLHRLRRLKLSRRGLQNVSMFAGWFLYWM